MSTLIPAINPSAEAIQKAYEKFIESEERRSSQGPRPHVYASTWCACTRQMALEMLYPDRMPAFPPDTLANFRRGRDRERDLLSDLARVGRECIPSFEVVGGQERFELRDKKDRVAIVGKVDARLKFAGIKGSPPLEIKSWHPNLTQGIKQFSDLFSNRWTRKGAHQLLAYLLATNEPLGFLLLDRPGIPRPLEVKLFDHLDKIEDFLQRAEIAMDAKEDYLHAEEIRTLVDPGFDGDKLPPYIDDPSECRVCPFFGHTCNPPLSYSGAAIITDEEVLIQLEHHEALKPQSKDYDQTHDDLSDYLKRMTPKEFKGKNKRQIIGGKFLIEAGWSKNTILEFPDDATKAKFQKSDDTGKFSFRVTKVAE